MAEKENAANPAGNGDVEPEKQPVGFGTRIVILAIAVGVLYWLWFVLSGMPGQVHQLPGEKVTLTELTQAEAGQKVLVEAVLDPSTGEPEPAHRLVVWELRRTYLGHDGARETEVLQEYKPPLILAGDGRTVGTGPDYEIKFPTHSFEVDGETMDVSRDLIGFRAGDEVVVAGRADGVGGLDPVFVTDGPFSDYEGSMTWRRWVVIVLVWLGRVILTPMLGLMALGAVLPNRKKPGDDPPAAGAPASDADDTPDDPASDEGPARSGDPVLRRPPRGFDPKDGSVPRDPKD